MSDFITGLIEANTVEPRSGTAASDTVAAPALAAVDTDCLHTDIIGCHRAKRE